MSGGLSPTEAVTQDPWKSPHRVAQRIPPAGAPPVGARHEWVQVSSFPEEFPPHQGIFPRGRGSRGLGSHLLAAHLSQLRANRQWRVSEATVVGLAHTHPPK